MVVLVAAVAVIIIVKVVVIIVVMVVVVVLNYNACLYYWSGLLEQRKWGELESAERMHLTAPYFNSKEVHTYIHTYIHTISAIVC